MGMNIGTNILNNSPTSNLITHAYIYDENLDTLKALSSTKICVLLAIGSSNATTTSLIDQNTVTYYLETVGTRVSIKNEVLTIIPSLSLFSSPYYSIPLQCPHYFQLPPTYQGFNPSCRIHHSQPFPSFLGLLQLKPHLCYLYRSTMLTTFKLERTIH
ncbi:Glucan endo-1,3-beta-glucosidase 1, partial [Mucuna pruriens]